MVEAPIIQFQKNQRIIVADSISQQRVSTALTSTDKSGKSTPIHITSNHLVYHDSEREAIYNGEVLARGPDITLTSGQMEVFFAPASQSAEKPATAGKPAQLQKIIASNSVVVTQPTRHATGDKLTYTSEDDRFILTGGPPSIFDAERGKITGVSLTLFRRDDRVIVDGNSSLPAVANTRVVR
jgi:lipopolysaccharide transport protein LptA